MLASASHIFQESPCSSRTTKDENVVQASLPASFGGKMPPLPSIFSEKLENF